MFNTNKQLITTILLGWSLLMLIFTFLDLPFSKAIYKGEASAFAHFFEVWGEAPAYLILFTAGNLLLRSNRLSTGIVRLIYAVAGIFFILVGGVGGSIISFSRMTESLGSGAILASVIITVLLTIVLQLLLNKLHDDTLRTYRRVAWAGIIIIFAEILIVNVIKIFWGRMRFREMLDNFALFTPWYSIQGFQENGVTSEVYKSFPSGHSANGWALVAFVLFMPIQRSWRMWTLSIAIVWGLCTSLSRVIYGAHFATDVLMGACITLICIFMISKWFSLSFIEDKPTTIARQKNIQM